MSLLTVSEVAAAAARIADALERIADHLEAREQDDEPDLYAVRPISRRRDDGQRR